MDGETLVLMSNHGTMEQLSACGLKTIKQQLLFRNLMKSQPVYEVNGSHQSGYKLSMLALKNMKEEDKRLYLIKYDN